MTRLSTGAELRTTGTGTEAAVVCVNGGQGRLVEGNWGATVEWLVQRLAPRLPELTFGEVRYRVKSWKRLDWCVEDAEAAIRELGCERTLLVGFSMGGAVAISAAGDPSVEAVVGLAPWIPGGLDLSPLAGRELVVLHGTLDRWFPGIPGVPAKGSRRGFDRARALGIEGRYVLIPGALHGVALRSPFGGLVTLPKANRWAELLELELRRLVGASQSG
jgi:pimeloyl-ACP methyl ester carboxylesterase